MAALAKGSLRTKRDQLIPALTGRVSEAHRFLLTQLLDHIEYLDRQIATVSGEVARRCGPFEEAVGLLQTIPGVERATAEVLLAETGGDMTHFPTAHHLASWVGLCPGNNESADKRRTGRTRKGNGGCGPRCARPDGPLAGPKAPTCRASSGVWPLPAVPAAMAAVSVFPWRVQ